MSESASQPKRYKLVINRQSQTKRQFQSSANKSMSVLMIRSNPQSNPGVQRLVIGAPQATGTVVTHTSVGNTSQLTRRSLKLVHVKNVSAIGAENRAPSTARVSDVLQRKDHQDVIGCNLDFYLKTLHKAPDRVLRWSNSQQFAEDNAHTVVNKDLLLHHQQELKDRLDPDDADTRDTSLNARSFSEKELIAINALANKFNCESS